MTQHTVPDTPPFDEHPPAALDAQAGDAALGAPTRVRIALYLAQRGCPGMSPARLQEWGRAAGMNRAEMAANASGTSHDAKGSACLAFVGRLLDDPCAPAAEDLARLAQAGYRPDQIAQVLAQVAACRHPCEAAPPLAQAG
jgi:hypothetical protein